MRCAAFSLTLAIMLSGCVAVPPPGQLQPDPEASGKPGVGNVILSGNLHAIYGFRGPALLFLIVTDGAPGKDGGGVTDYFGLETTWYGSIAPLLEDHKEIDFKAGNSGIEFDKVKFDFAQGRAFVIQTHQRPMDIQQLAIPLRSQIEGIVTVDPRFGLPEPIKTPVR